MSIPFDVEELTLGDAREHNIPGVYGPFPPHLENAFGFHIGGFDLTQFLQALCADPGLYRHEIFPETRKG